MIFLLALLIDTRNEVVTFEWNENNDVFFTNLLLHLS